MKLHLIKRTNLRYQEIKRSSSALRMLKEKFGLIQKYLKSPGVSNKLAKLVFIVEKESEHISCITIDMMRSELNVSYTKDLI
ncbi:hypothetical protein RhiirA5_441359 [Rhizophagus irregularis]|uniref:Uncharacterized protein n=1 Tax=Rhizophagus irregularis TaxID=588596 RepID=A0A2N0NFT4_9GLOM|nr:hypothetical protein RhiirA5_441359 [Rhizophagus irregularis]